MASEVGGRVAAFPARRGRPGARPGAVVARLDDTELGLARDEARAAAELARASLDLALAGAREEDIAQAVEAAAAATETSRRADEDLARMRDLYSAGSVTQKQRDDAEARATVTAAQARAARAALEKGPRPRAARGGARRPRAARSGEAGPDRPSAGCRGPGDGADLRRGGQAPAEVGEIVAPGFPLATSSTSRSSGSRSTSPEPDLPRVRGGRGRGERRARAAGDGPSRGASPASRPKRSSRRERPDQGGARQARLRGRDRARRIPKPCSSPACPPTPRIAGAASRERARRPSTRPALFKSYGACGALRRPLASMSRRA